MIPDALKVWFAISNLGIGVAFLGVFTGIVYWARNRDRFRWRMETTAVVATGSGNAAHDWFLAHGVGPSC